METTQTISRPEAIKRWNAMSEYERKDLYMKWIDDRHNNWSFSMFSLSSGKIHQALNTELKHQ